MLISVQKLFSQAKLLLAVACAHGIVPLLGSVHLAVR